MATYVNNLRLTELATGEGSGTWGTTTNTNLELIGEALGYGSEAIANASTHTITVADGTADSARSFYLKLTGGGQACTVTLAPNTLSKVWMVENTTNSTLTFSQGSGANVAVPAGQVKMIATDGAGSGAVVYDLLVDTDLTGTTTVVNLTSSGTIDAATVEFNSLSGTGAVAVTDILDQDNMSSNSATALATQQSIKAYVDSSVASFDTLAEVLAQGNTTGSTDIEVTTAQKVQFRDAAIYINSSADGQLDIVADTEIQIAATTIDINGAINASGEIIAASLDISGNIDVDGTTNLDVVDIDGAVDMAAALTVAGTATFTDTILVTRADNSTQLTLESTDAGASVGPRFDLHRNSASPAASDNLGQIRFLGDDSAGVTTSYAFINSFISSPTDGSESGEIVIETRVGGANRQRFTANPTETIINEDGADLDFRVESDSNTNMLLINAGNNSVSIGTSTAEATFTVGGSATFNADSADADFRVESNGNANMLFVDGGNNRVGVGLNAPTRTLHVADNAADPYVFVDGSAGNRDSGFSINAGAGQKIAIRGDSSGSLFYGNENQMLTNSTGVAFNEGSADLDFRVESDANTHMLFVDGGTNHVGIGTPSPQHPLSIRHSDKADPQIHLETASYGNSYGVKIHAASTNESGTVSSFTNIYKTTASVNTRLNVQQHISYVSNTATSDYQYWSAGGSEQLRISGGGSVSVAGNLLAEDIKAKGSGGLTLQTDDGVKRIILEDGGNVVINETGVDADFRVESDTNTHALFVDGGNSRVGINESSPKGDFHVTGGADSLIFLDGTTSVANSPTTLFTISLPGTANAVFVTLFVHGIASGVAWFAFKQDFVASRGGTILATAGDVVETSGGGTMTLNISGSNLNVQFNHASSTADTMNWSAVIQGKPGTIS